MVFSEIKPSNKTVELCREKIDESKYVCGNRVDVLRKFACNEKIHCTNDIETLYYSDLTDMAIENVICYAYGVELSRVLPTCGKERCTKFNTKLFMTKRA